jgi:hypothetical protein
VVVLIYLISVIPPERMFIRVGVFIVNHIENNRNIGNRKKS